MKYLKFILTVIAFCLLTITANILGFLPAVQAKSYSNHFVNLPLNPDGSLNVRLVKNETLDVNINQINGKELESRTLDVNIDQIGANPIIHQTLDVNVANISDLK